MQLRFSRSEAFADERLKDKDMGIELTPRCKVLRTIADPNYVMIDLEFDNTAEAEAFVQKMQRIWDGPAKGVMLNPRARIADLVEGKDV